jgi:hypothetical protein
MIATRLVAFQRELISDLGSGEDGSEWILDRRTHLNSVGVVSKEEWSSAGKRQRRDVLGLVSGVKMNQDKSRVKRGQTAL